MDKKEQHKARKRHIVEALIAVLLVVCVVVVAFWQIMASRSHRAFDPFEITVEDFADFHPESPFWHVRRLSVKDDPLEPNILVFELRPNGRRRTTDRGPRTANHGPNVADQESRTQNLPFSSPIIIRLVHGYNMRDCMRLKGYKVDLIADYPTAELRTQNSEPPASLVRVQTWRLTSISTGDTSIWLTGMLESGDFRQTTVDVRSMAFPRIIGSEDAGWIPRGLTWASLRHPFRNFRLFLRKEWSNARSDLLTFLKLRRPAWASNEMLTLVTAWWGPSLEPEQEEQAAQALRSAYAFMLSELHEK